MKAAGTLNEALVRLHRAGRADTYGAALPEFSGTSRHGSILADMGLREVTSRHPLRQRRPGKGSGLICCAILSRSRFDRSIQDGRLMRHAQEDATQVLGLRPGAKYDPDAREVIGALSSVCASPLVACRDLLHQLLYSYAIGNNDVHAKPVDRPEPADRYLGGHPGLRRSAHLAV